MINREQALLAKVLDLFARTFDKNAVLRGGMVLRILGSQRLTNDLDYVFVPYKSKKAIIPAILNCLKSIEGATVDYTLNSKCLRVVLTADQATIQIEAKVAMDIKTATTSTKLFSLEFNLPQRIIHVVDYSVAMANKMAAWNERRLIRDIYDIWFFIRMQVEPDTATLESRLKFPSYSRLVRRDDYFKGTTAREFYEFLRTRVSRLSDQEVAEAMSDYLPREEITGLAMMFRAAMARLP
ncbi:MAG: nucleotidyl transferase AbiEii/AbiGii toxin family protein [bacterium]